MKPTTIYSITRYISVHYYYYRNHYQTLGLNTIQDMANYKYYHVACTIQTLSTIEEITTKKKNAEGEEGDGDGGDATTTTTTTTNLCGNRLPNTLMNINKAIDKEYEHLTLNEMFTITHIFMHYKVYPANNEDKIT